MYPLNSDRFNMDKVRFKNKILDKVKDFLDLINNTIDTGDSISIPKVIEYENNMFKELYEKIDDYNIDIAKWRDNSFTNDVKLINDNLNKYKNNYDEFNDCSCIIVE